MPQPKALIDDKLIKYMHLRSIDFDTGHLLPHGGLTIAFRKKQWDPLANCRDEEGLDIYEVALAECSSRDNFCKKIGRSIAKGRLLCGMFSEVKTNKTKMKEVTEDIASWVTQDES